VKHVNSRAGSGYPARGIKMPSPDFRGILKTPLFHCSFIIIIIIIIVFQAG
jgi:hypothetical protein